LISEITAEQQGKLPTHIIPVLNGGGGRLPAHIGVLAAVEQLGFSYTRLVGVSGGSIVGSLAAAGYTLEEIRQIANNTDFKQFFGQSLFSLLRTGGLSSGNVFEQWMDDKLDGRTFADLDTDLHVVATDVRSGQPVIFNKQDNPDMKVALAVRFSMSLPILFSFKEFGGHLMVDGSILSEEALQRKWGDSSCPVVVFKLRSTRNTDRRKTSSLMPLKSYLSMLVDTFITTMSREYIHQDYWLSTVVIDTGSMSPIEFTLNEDEKDRLYSVGYETTSSVLPHKLSRYCQALPGE